jgi:hypothetical protein
VTESVQFCYPPHLPHNRLLTSSTYACRSEDSFCGFIPLALSAWPQRMASARGSQCWLSLRGFQRWLSALGSQHWGARLSTGSQRLASVLALSAWLSALTLSAGLSVLGSQIATGQSTSMMILNGSEYLYTLLILSIELTYPRTPKLLIHHKYTGKTQTLECVIHSCLG